MSNLYTISFEDSDDEEESEETPPKKETTPPKKTVHRRPPPRSPDHPRGGRRAPRGRGKRKPAVKKPAKPIVVPVQTEEEEEEIIVEYEPEHEEEEEQKIPQPKAPEPPANVNTQFPGSIRPQPIRRPVKIEQRPSYTYRCNRNIHIGIGKKMIFRFYFGEDLKYSAKAKSYMIGKTKFVIDQGEDVHLSAPQHDAVLINSQKYNFDLFQNSDTGPLRMHMESIDVESSDIKPKITHATFISDAGETFCLKSMEPTFNEIKGTWQLDFNGRFVLKSLKNMILVTESNEVEIIIRKTTPTDLEVESFVDFLTPLQLFGVAIGSFLKS